MAINEAPFKLKLVYVFRINDEAHRGCLKVGDTYLSEDSSDPMQLVPNSKPLNKAARERIDQYTATAGIAYELLYTELNFCLRSGYIFSFNDGEVHSVLKRSGVKVKIFKTEGGTKSKEWFLTDLETVKRAIKAAKEGRCSLYANEMTTGFSPIQFRDEQRDAIEKTIRRFRTNNQYLWNAKMRFGKTLCALEVVKRMDFRRTLILTHRPVVNDGWFDDFQKIFYDSDHFQYGSKNGKGETFESLERQFQKRRQHYVYFASMQDLRGSELVGGNYDKNDAIFSTEWDLLVVDEAHEGTQTSLGKAVVAALFHDNTKKLDLSGTPFSLLDEYNDADIFTWDYVMEQRAKQEWEQTHDGDTNPYAGLPRLNIYTYDLSLELKHYQDGDHAFNFSEFFRVEGKGSDEHFRHDEDVNRFLNLLTSAKDYPFSRQEWRGYFRHSLWTLPSVAAARCMSIKLRNHPILGKFQVVNVAGDGDSDADYESNNALEQVREAIGDRPEETMTITLTRGRLTTGVTVKAWTAVFMLHGSYSTSASSYMQTIFRAQTPAIIGGRQKRECYVFDFAPDRTLKVLAETAKISSKAGRTSESDRQLLGEFLNFCPVISFEGSKMHAIDTPHMMQQLKRVYVERVVSNGFEDKYLYNDQLMKLDQFELEKFSHLRGIIGQTKAMKRSNEVDVNNQGFTDEEYEKLECIKKKKRQNNHALTPEEADLLVQEEKKKKQRNIAINILRGISIRMPMLLYGANIEDEDKEITIDNFTSLVDDISWDEFMPRGVTKELFDDFKRYYDPDIFAASGKRIREQARYADSLDIEARIDQIATIFGTFRNPDKETVLTPWRVVNMQLGDTLGGWVFYDGEYKERQMMPREVRYSDVTDSVFRPDTKILEINSKSGLYPLYMAYSIYRNRIEAERLDWMTTEADDESRLKHHQRVWDEVLRQNIFIVCKTPMARYITIRTLAGFRPNVKVNAHAFDDLIMQIQHKNGQLITKLSSPYFWKYNSDELMKFNAIVGNPPYQLMGGSGGTNDAPIYQFFCDTAIRLKPNFISLITPGRWFSGGRDSLLGDFRKRMLTSGHVKKLFAFADSHSVFPTVEIKGGVSYFLIEEKYKGFCNYSLMANGEVRTSQIDLNAFDILIRDPNLNTIVQKVDAIRKANGQKCVDSIMSADTPFGIPTNPGKSIKTPFEMFSTKNKNHDILVYYLEENQRKTAFCRRTDIKKNAQDIDKYKVFVPKAGGSGNDPIVLGNPIVSKGKSVCSQTFIYAAFETYEESFSFAKYIATRFLRVIVSSVKITQDALSGAYRFVPLQDLTSSSDIDWSASIEDIDRQLYRKYNLSDEEINYIEKTIKPMGNNVMMMATNN
jgi:hypothetical protein